NMEVDVERLIGSTYFDVGQFREAEPHLRRAVDLLSSHHGGLKETRSAKSRLADCLRQQGRHKEAAAIDRHDGEAFGYQDYAFILTDEEKAALKNAKARPSAAGNFKKPQP